MIGRWVSIYERQPLTVESTYLCVLNNLTHDTRICIYLGCGEWDHWPMDNEYFPGVVMWLETPDPSDVIEKGTGIRPIDKKPTIS